MGGGVSGAEAHLLLPSFSVFGVWVGMLLGGEGIPHTTYQPRSLNPRKGGGGMRGDTAT